ncbi:hypothetical protein LZ30DRAFT_591735 [Colletotrichum cereale]|nr:hypothetical protein LZ30DRAFT_591735 [Colletotrichum cereale]
MSSEQDYQDLFGPQAKKAKRGRLQTDKSANAIRIRDNQRRSRARHKEFVGELQRKVQEYEKRGIEASLQMQKAARDVAIENSRLRALLASRGVSSDQVDAYLRSFDDDPKGSSAIPINTTLAPILSAPIHSTTSSESSRSPHPYDRTSQTPPRPAEPQRHQHHNQRQHQHLQQQQQHHHLPTVSPHEMSCNAAARIIADMQGGSGDDRKTKIALGCRPQDDECFVKNTSIFRVLDHR